MSVKNPAEANDVITTSGVVRASANRRLDETRLGLYKIAVLIPCYNEERTITKVVEQFRHELPQASIYVFDNNSTDQTAERASAAGAEVFYERRQGKGFVTQAMFRQIDADVYVMVDGDETYPAAAGHRLLAPVMAGEADMVVGSRLHAESQSEFKQLNAVGNRLVLGVLNSIFRVKLTDILSGYRAFSRSFVKGLPLFGGGFEVETELTIKAINRGFRIQEIPIDLSHRPPGSHSKIRVFRDGLIIGNTILALFRDYKPLTFFGITGIVLFILAWIPGLIVIFKDGAGPLTHWPAVFISLFLGLCGLLSITVGMVLHSIARRAQEFEHQLQVLAEQVRSDNARGHNRELAVLDKF